MASDNKYEVKVPDFDYYFENIKCLSACPVNTRAYEYVAAVQRGDYQEAYRIAREPNPLARICSLVCGAHCEKQCRRGNVDAAVAVRALKKVVCDPERVDLNAGKKVSPERLREERVAIVGSGPAGMGAAHDLALLGYGVTVFEQFDRPGGMLGHGVPPYRLPRDVLEGEYDRILDLGVELRLGTRVGGDITLRELREQYDAVLIAVGMQLSRALPIEGIDLEGVLHGVDILRDLSTGKEVKLGKKVIVVGGGNVAFDVARTCVRQGVRDVMMVVLENREELPADDIEYDEGREEGIEVRLRLGPKRILGEDGRVTGLETLDVESVFDEEGRFNPRFYDGTEKQIEADTVLLTIGQASDLSLISEEDGIQDTRGTLAVDEDGVRTNVEGVFVAGDVAKGPALLIDALASGRRAAEAIHTYLGKERVKRRVNWRMRRLNTEMMYFGLDDGGETYRLPAAEDLTYDRRRRVEPPAVSVQERVKGYDPVEQSYEERTARKQASRCLRCNINVVFNGDRCILCGGCVDVCPENCLKLVRLDKVEPNELLDELVKARLGRALTELQKDPEAAAQIGSIMIKDEDTCIRCGLCERRCPVGAITMEVFEFREEVSYEPGG